MVSKITTPITPLEQTEKINEIIDNLGIGGFNILEHKWSDHIINDISWLRADTFSWQDGTVYSEAYNHLVADYNGGTSTTETVGSYTITYVLADDGHKITTDETNVANIYNESGVAWYYILDTTNQRFKLPRTKYGFVGLRDTVGKYVPESLPNIRAVLPHNFRGMATYPSSGTETNGAFMTEVTSSGQYGGSGTTYRSVALSFSANRDNSTYQDNAPVQQRATQMYLYFYVGQFTQTAIEQTAGLNSELFNGKVDLNADNLSTQGKSLISGLGMPSGRYENLTLGSSGTEYTAPANGYFCLMKNSNAGGQNIALNNNTNPGLSSFATNSATTQALRCFIPVHKNDIMAVGYTAGGVVQWFRFYYAEGEENV